jgi:hypothetical protein
LFATIKAKEKVLEISPQNNRVRVEMDLPITDSLPWLSSEFTIIYYSERAQDSFSLYEELQKGTVCKVQILSDPNL